MERLEDVNLPAVPWWRATDDFGLWGPPFFAAMSSEVARLFDRPGAQVAFMTGWRHFFVALGPARAFEEVRAVGAWSEPFDLTHLSFVAEGAFVDDSFGRDPLTVSLLVFNAGE